LATSQYMHHDLDTRGIIAQLSAGINTFFTFSKSTEKPAFAY